MAVFIQKESRHFTILTLWKFDHGLASVVLLFLFVQILSPPATAQIPNALPPPPPDPFSRLRFDKSMAIIMVILVVVFFILGFLSVYTRQCAERRIRGRFDFTIQPGGSDRLSRRGPRGLSPEVIDTFPTFVYSTVKGLKIGTSMLECAVCLNEFRDDETLRLIPKCNHVFHSRCIDVWLSSHSTCPVCRDNLIPRPDDMFDAAVQIPDPGVESNELDPTTEHEENQNMDTTRENQNRGTDLPKMNFFDRSQSTDQNRLPGARSPGFSFPTLLRRSHSTGNSLVQPGEDSERYTLRLPKDVRSQLQNSTLNRTKSCITFRRMSSGRMDYRTRSVGSHEGSNLLHKERFGGEGRPERWWFTLTPPFFSLGGSSRSGKRLTESNDATVDGSGVTIDSVEGEGSTDRLFGDAQV